MISSSGLEKPVSVFHPVMIALWLTVLLVTGCSQKEPPLSPEARAFKMDVGSLLSQMQKSLTGPASQSNVAVMDKVLQSFAQTTSGMCVDCPYRLGILNKSGDLLTTYPKNEIIGLNFSTYKKILEPVTKHRISQTQAYLADGSKMYFISAPLIKDNQAQGVLILALSPADLEKKWHLSEKEFLAIDFNMP